MLTEHQTKILHELRIIGGVLWADRIEKCDMEKIIIKNDKRLNLCEHAYCIVGEVRNQLDNDKSMALLFSNSGCFHYGCGDCDRYGNMLYSILNDNNYVKSEQWWRELEKFIDHCKQSHSN